MPSRYSFRQFTEEDLGLVAEWLQTSEVSRWFPDLDYIEDIEEQMMDSRMSQNIVYFEDAPLAYIQDYDIDSYDNHHLSFLPKGSRGLDTFIGKSEMMNLGHGKTYLKAYIDVLFAKGIPAVGIDPDIGNERAIRVYQDIGFQGTDEAKTEWGHLRLMSRVAN